MNLTVIFIMSPPLLLVFFYIIMIPSEYHLSISIHAISAVSVTRFSILDSRTSLSPLAFRLLPELYLRRIAQIFLIMRRPAAVLTEIPGVFDQFFYALQIPFYYDLTDMILYVAGTGPFTAMHIFE